MEVDKTTILEKVWRNDKDVVIKLLALRLLHESTFKVIIGEPLPKVDIDKERESIERLMRHDSFKRISGKIRQVKWR